MCAPTAAQYAALAALNTGFENGFAEVKYMRDKYNERRQYLVSRLNAMGLTCFEPRGAFYAFPCVKSTGLDGEAFAYALLDAKNVAVVPGGAFGESGKDFIRISYAYSIEAIKKALDLIEEFLNERKYLKKAKIKGILFRIPFLLVKITIFGTYHLQTYIG